MQRMETAQAAITGHFKRRVHDTTFAGMLAARTERALCAGGPSELGGILSQAQAVFDEWVAPACPELRAPVLHEVLTHLACRELAYGGKGVGSQGDGCAQLVARGPAERALLAQRLESELSMSSLPLTLGG